MATLNVEGAPFGDRGEFPMAVGVGDAGGFVDHTTLDIPERQALIAVDPPQPYPYYHVVLLDRVDASSWITADPEGNVEERSAHGRDVAIVAGDVLGLTNPEWRLGTFRTKSFGRSVGTPNLFKSGHF